MSKSCFGCNRRWPCVVIHRAGVRAMRQGFFYATYVACQLDGWVVHFQDPRVAALATDPLFDRVGQVAMGELVSNLQYVTDEELEVLRSLVLLEADEVALFNFIQRARRQKIDAKLANRARR